jgi:hypothetical protein
MDFRQNNYDIFTMVIKVKHLLFVIGLGITCGTGIFFLYGGFDYDDIYKNANVWYKVSTDELNLHKIVAIDMSKGYSACDMQYVYLVSYELDTKKEIVVVFPNGDYWKASDIDTLSVEIQKNFGKLEQDLKSK